MLYFINNYNSFFFKFMVFNSVKCYVYVNWKFYNSQNNKSSYSVEVMALFSIHNIEVFKIYDLSNENFSMQSRDFELTLR